ncbi:MAG: glycosyl hydrolase [Firmicutes bacterium]|nr:glycosyl hydrolase [Bacillota bacterium]
MDQQLFFNPPNTFRIKPFWFWNDAVTEEGTRRQLEAMAQQGVGGFFLCPRQGLKLPYLSDAWFAAVRTAVEVAASLGLEVWLYDELPYPSGMAGGTVLLKYPEARHRLLEVDAFEVPGGTHVARALPWGQVLWAGAVPQNRGAWDWTAPRDLRPAIGTLPTRHFSQGGALTALHRLRFFSYDPGWVLDWTAPPGGPWKVLVFIERELKTFKYFGTFVDPGHREAVQEFMRLTHERYRETVGDYFGTVVRGIFSDEVFYLGRRPWSSRLLDTFRARRGYDLQPHLPHLVEDIDDRTPRIRYHYYLTAHELLTESYHQQIRAWCDQQGLLYTAEVPTLRMSGQRPSHIPGGDSAHEKLGEPLAQVLHKYAGHLRSDPKVISGMARQFGQGDALIECFHSVGWSMTLQDAKWMLDRLAVMGINHYTFHAFYYSINSLRKHDAPPSQFLQNPYWPYFRALADYAARLAYWVSQGTADIPIAVVLPTTSRWTRTTPEHAEDDPWTAWIKTLAVTLWTHHIDFDYLDTDLLGEASCDGATLTLGQARYHAVVVPPLTNLEEAAWARLKQFAQQGGWVLMIAPGPTEALGSPQVLADIQETLATAVAAEPLARVATAAHWALLSTYETPRSAAETVVAWLRDAGLISVRLAGAEPLVRATLCQSRRLDDGSRLLLLVNQESASGAVTVEVEGHDGWAVELWDLETGQVSRVGQVQDGRFSLTLGPYGARAVRLAKESARSLLDEGPVFHWVVEGRALWDVEDEAPNLLRLGRFRLRIGDSSAELEAAPLPLGVLLAQPTSQVLLAHVPFRFESGFGIPPQPTIAYPFAVRFEATFQVRDDLPSCLLVGDEDAVVGSFTLYVNDTPLDAPPVQPRRRFETAQWAVDVAPYLHCGKNTIALVVQVQGDDDGVVDALYLEGPFGVQWDVEAKEPVLTAAIQKVSQVASVPPDRPFYAGKRRFVRTVRLEDPPAAGPFVLQFADWPADYHEPAEVRVNGTSLGRRSWLPYMFQGRCELLRKGDNIVEVITCQSLGHALEGLMFDEGTRAMRPVMPDAQG